MLRKETKQAKNNEEQCVNFRGMDGTQQNREYTELIWRHRSKFRNNQIEYDFW